MLIIAFNVKKVIQIAVISVKLAMDPQMKAQVRAKSAQ
jgi:hypothetical protein